LPFHIAVTHELHHVKVLSSQFHCILRLNEFRSIQYWLDIIHHGFHVHIHHVRMYGTLLVQFAQSASFKDKLIQLSLVCLGALSMGFNIFIFGLFVSEIHGSCAKL